MQRNRSYSELRRGLGLKLRFTEGKWLPTKFTCFKIQFGGLLLFSGVVFLYLLVSCGHACYQIPHQLFAENQIYENEVQQILWGLEQPIIDTDFSHIFKGNLSNKTSWEFDFSEISKRRFGRNYIEFTSADPEGRNVDFFNPLSFSNRSMVVLEDYGPGILERILLHHLSKKQEINHVIIEVDGERLFMVSDRERAPEETFPFKGPLFRANQVINTGYFLTFPIAYQKSIRVIIQWNLGRKFGDQIWNIIDKCKRESRSCPVRGYFAVSYNKFVQGTILKNTFKGYFLPDNSQAKFLKQVANAVSEMAKAPEEFGPGMKSGCELTCQMVSSGEEIEIFSAVDSSQVIQSIVFRVYDVMDKVVMSKNWKTMLITMTWDGKEPQVKEIPLAGLFTVGWDYLREVRSLNAGVKMRSCSSQGYRASEMKSHDWLAYLFYDMPFWKSAKITIKRVSGISPGIICTKITAKPLVINQYNPRFTGYFSGQLNQQEFGLTHMTILRLENQWGHVVAINFFERDRKFGATQENDIITEIDQANVPTISGTGLEDYFGYVHSFFHLRNTSSIFNGVPYFRDYVDGRRLRCYRHMTFDPILFTRGILIYLEGHFDRYERKVYRNFTQTSSKFNQTIDSNSLVTVVLYYGSKGNGGIVTDKVDYKDLMADGNLTISPEKGKFNPAKVDVFPVNAMFENQPHMPFDRIVFSMSPGQTVTHTFQISKNNVGVILRREYRTVVPNQKAHVEIDGENAGVWFCPQRALSKEFSLRLNDFHLPPRCTAGKDSIKVTLKAVTQWETISIVVVSVVLTE